MKNRSGDREGDGVGPSGHGNHGSNGYKPLDSGVETISRRAHPSDKYGREVIVEKSQKFIANADRMMQVVGSSPKRPRNKRKSRSTEESSGSRLVRSKRGKRPINFEGELTFLILSSHPKTQIGSITPMDITSPNESTPRTAHSTLPSLHLGPSQCWERDLSQELKEYTLLSSSKARKPTLSKLLDSYQIMVEESGLFSWALHDRCHKNETKKAQWRVKWTSAICAINENSRFNEMNPSSIKWEEF
ncbi:hypothetical protein GOBAR_AA01912 [Gossypium barbadense]|uniref:Uncharacterized protein n=1 Tax=Gossypium barbadense TaxID=3634 RepID=A0A2P5YST1_GOSBA|nr:hypothetical protein GOBAR_AA01912 [Gossypium barbadense]